MIHDITIHFSSNITNGLAVIAVFTDHLSRMHKLSDLFFLITSCVEEDHMENSTDEGSACFNRRDEQRMKPSPSTRRRNWGGLTISVTFRKQRHDNPSPRPAGTGQVCRGEKSRPRTRTSPSRSLFSIFTQLFVFSCAHNPVQHFECQP